MPDTKSRTSRLLDQHFGDWVARHFSSHLKKETEKKQLKKLAEAVSYATHLKHSCLDLSAYARLENPILEHLLKGIRAIEVKHLITPDVKPLECSADGRYLWLQKYHRFEQGVAKPLQRMAAEQRLHIVTGGPGTGKTWTAAQRIREALEINPALRIQLAAPTGKAANNMMMALSKAALKIHEPACTLHSLLGMRRHHPKPARHADNPLAVDMLVIDEASMIDLPMMFHLLQAIPPHATLLLLGDKDQLASVEAGSVLHEICEVKALAGVVKTLTKNWRSEQSPEIGILASALNKGSVPDLSTHQKVLCHLLPAENPWNPPWLEQAITRLKAQHVARQHMEVREALLSQKQFQILCALREGPQGVAGINYLIEKNLSLPTYDEWYEGKPVMITQNDHERKLYNGDVGLVLNIDGKLKACFSIDHEVKMISRAQMPTHETCYAITVHKSQGSEYDHVLIVLPAETSAVLHNPVLTRELLYTAVTRARESIELWCGESVLQAMASKKFERMSGLGEMV